MHSKGGISKYQEGITWSVYTMWTGLNITCAFDRDELKIIAIKAINNAAGAGYSSSSSQAGCGSVVRRKIECL